MIRENVANKRYKDTVFRMLFSDKERLLQLYNAVSGTDYDEPDDLIVTTLENAIYMSMKNDISCMVDMRLALFEHQSTVNPNMPLRDLYYVSDTFAKFHNDKDMYSPRLIRLPNPRFIVFYNGEAKQPAIRQMRLSDAYTHNEDKPHLELVVTQININPGYNGELLRRCPVLGEYVSYVDKVRTYQRQMSLDEAVDRAVNECIAEGILADFLRANKAEVKNMSIYEYDEELHIKTMMDIGREEGYEAGIIAVAKEMIKNGDTNEYVSKITKLTVQEVSELRSNLQPSY